MNKEDVDRFFEDIKQELKEREEWERLQKRAGWKEWEEFARFQTFSLDACALSRAVESIAKTFDMDKESIYGVPLKEMKEHFQAIAKLGSQITAHARKAIDAIRDTWLDTYEQKQSVNNEE